MPQPLAPAENKYSQIEKGLAVVWGVKKFHLFLLWEFVILSDHKPSQFLFNEKKTSPNHGLRTDCTDIKYIQIPHGIPSWERTG